MAEDDTLLPLGFAVVGLGPTDIRTLASFKRDSPWMRVIHVKAAIELDLGWGSNVNYTLYKANLAPGEELRLDKDVAPFLDPSQKLRNVALVSKTWPDGIQPDRISLIVNVTSVRRTLPPPWMYDNSSSIDIPHAGEKVDGFPGSPTAQTGHSCQTDSRPCTAGLPIGLYHPVFDSFIARLNSTSDMASSEELACTHRLLEAFQSSYESGLGASDRAVELINLLDEFTSLGEAHQEQGIKRGGHILAPNGALCFTVEARNEDDTNGSDFSDQVKSSYYSHWRQPRMDRIRFRCCCPSFIIAVSGPRICVLGAVNLDRPIIQPLTPYLYVANHSSLRTQPSIHELVRVFTSLSSSISELFKFYAGLALDKFDHERFTPFIRHFTNNGTRVEFQYAEGMKAGKPIFTAWTKSRSEDSDKDFIDNTIIVVKFVESYHATAHRLLAEAQLAPKLLFVSSKGTNGFKVAGLSMIVMERVMGEDISEMMTIPSCVIKDVSRALEILHSHNIVFGDLRDPNVVTMQDERGKVTGGRLVDFDWCGEDGQAQYPTGLNPEIDWPEGVGPGTTMRIIHDKIMFGKLF